MGAGAFLIGVGRRLARAVVEFGPLSQTIHQVDERITVADLETLTNIYRGILERYFVAFPS